jgi:pyridoxine 5-phosphate synthase
MTKLSVNINKVATLRNARGGNNPDLLKVAKDIQNFGADGITIHPRPDERHIKYSDAINLKDVVHTELNIEGNPIDKFVELVLNVKPEQVTLVPDSVDVLTSNAGWNTKKEYKYLRDVIEVFKKEDIRTSIFVDPDIESIKYAEKTNCDRIELYTELYANNYDTQKEKTIELYSNCSKLANKLGMQVNAGHDLNLKNIEFFSKNMPFLDEVSIGHALISESLYIGLENVINLYINKLNK